MVNKVTLVGNIGGDIETKKFEKGNQVSWFSLATSKRYKGSDGETQTQTQWHKVVVWNGNSKFAENYLGKGYMVYVEGEIAYKDYENKDGQKVYMTEIVASNLKILKKVENNSDSTPTPAPADIHNSESSKSKSEKQDKQSTGGLEPNPFFDDGEEDDLPF